MMDFPIFRKSWFLGSKSRNSGQINDFWKDSGIPGIVELPGSGNDGFSKFFRNPWFLVSKSWIPDKSMISRRFPHAKPSKNKSFPPTNFSPKPKQTVSGKSFSGKSFSGKMFLGGNVSGGERFPQCLYFWDYFWFRDFWHSLASRISLEWWIFQIFTKSLISW